MSIAIAYLGLGVVAYFALYRLFRKSGMPVSRLNMCWFAFDWLVLFLWPLSTLLVLSEYSHLVDRKRKAKEREEALKCHNKYSHLSMDELLAEQKKALDSLTVQEE